jgi:hypothetical protein
MLTGDGGLENNRKPNLHLWGRKPNTANLLYDCKEYDKETL